jgi:hypothetical protein
VVFGLAPVRSKNQKGQRVSLYDRNDFEGRFASLLTVIVANQKHMEGEFC